MPVWVWSGVSAVILIVLVTILVINKLNPGSADSPTRASSEANLAKQTLPSDLPTLVEFQGGEGSAADLFRVVAGVQTIMRSGGFEEEKAEASLKVIAALKPAAKTQMPRDLLDKRIPKKRVDSPEVKKDLQALTTAVSTYVKNQLKDFKFAPAREAAYAQVLLGKQIFENNTRLKSRQSGLAVMNSGLNNLQQIERAAYDDAEIDKDELAKRNEKIMQWMNARKDINDKWGIKLKAIETVASKKGLPNTADMKKITQKDEDPTFRIFAARRLGYALYERGDPGNQRFLKETIELLSNSDDKAVAAATKDGASVTRDEYQDLRK